jgi:hypothetical protein
VGEETRQQPAEEASGEEGRREEASRQDGVLGSFDGGD